MKWIAIAPCVAAAASTAYADGPPLANIGDTYEIRREYQTSQTDSEGGSGSSSGHDTITERTVSVREEGGVELEYDLPPLTKVEDRNRQWQLPARVFKPTFGPMKLLNEAELAARGDQWLKLAKLPSSACGSWYFTWNAFRVECDPQGVLKLIADFDPWPDLIVEGAEYRDASAAAPARLVRGDTPNTLIAVLAVDPVAVRRERAESDVVAAEIVHRKSIPLEAAIADRAGEDVSGTITVTIEPGNASHIGRITKKHETDHPDAGWKDRGPQYKVDMGKAVDRPETR